MSFSRLAPEIDRAIPKWLRYGFLTVLVIHDLAMGFAGFWGLQFPPAQLQAAVGATWIDEVWGWMWVLGALLSLFGAVSQRPAVESIGCVLVAGGFFVLGASTLGSHLFGDYSISGGIAFYAAGLASVRRIGRVWAGAFLRGREGM